MKYLKIYILALTMIASSLTGQDHAESTDITVIVENIKSKKGAIRVALYDSEKNWLRQFLVGEVGEIIEGKSSIVFRDIEAGVYGISLFHDENNNDELDSGLFGIPTEPFACSNQAKGKFGPPKWADAKFEYDGKSMLHIIKL